MISDGLELETVTTKKVSVLKGNELWVEKWEKVMV
jgi:hypothetical protein